MKYFTRKWWRDTSDGDDQASTMYAAYFASIKARLPGQLVILEAEYTLHDARVQSAQSDQDRHRMSIILNGWNQSLSYPMRYTLQFSGVSEPEQQSSWLLKHLSDLGDLGYWELELLPDNAIEMRMIFASALEFKIIFSDFEFQHELLPRRTRPA